MQWLSDWLRQIIAVVLLAGIVDLLLPGNAYHRYVRLVVGLLVLMTLLTPVLQLLQADWQGELSKRVASISGLRLADVPAMPTLSQIRADGAHLQQARQEEAARLTATQLAESIKASLQQQSGLAIAHVEAKLTAIDGREAEAGKPQAYQLAGVTIWLAEEEAQPSTGDNASDGVQRGQMDEAQSSGEQAEEAASKARTVAPVARIRVQVAPVEADKTSVPHTAAALAAEAQWLPPTDTRVQLLTRLLAAQWELAPARIRIAAYTNEGRELPDG